MRSSPLSHVLSAVVLLVLAALAHSLDLPDQIVVGYWENWNGAGDGFPITECPTTYDVINVAFVTRNLSTGRMFMATHSEQYTRGEGGFYATTEELKQDIATVQERGQKVVLSLGGAADPILLETDEDELNFMTDMIQIIDEYGFDGFDVNYESQSGLRLDVGDVDPYNPTTDAIRRHSDTLRSLAEHFVGLNSNFIVSMSPELLYVQGGYVSYANNNGAYWPIIEALRPYLAWVSVQHYNSAGMYGLDDQLHDLGTADFNIHMAEVLLQGFRLGGWSNQEGVADIAPLEPSQVMIGLPSSEFAAQVPTPLPEIKETMDTLLARYPGFRGLMTWSIVEDKNNRREPYEFINYVRPLMDGYLANSPAVVAESTTTNQTTVPVEEITVPPVAPNSTVPEEANIDTTDTMITTTITDGSDASGGTEAAEEEIIVPPAAGSEPIREPTLPTASPSSTVVEEDNIDTTDTTITTTNTDGSDASGGSDADGITPVTETEATTGGLTPTTEAVDMVAVEFVQPFAGEAGYMTGDLIIFFDEEYRSVIDNNYWSPVAAPQYWDEVNGSTNSTDRDVFGNGEEFVQAMAGDAGYMNGDIISFEGTRYMSMIDNNYWSPSRAPQLWSLVF